MRLAHAALSLAVLCGGAVLVLAAGQRVDVQPELPAASVQPKDPSPPPKISAASPQPEANGIADPDGGVPTTAEADTLQREAPRAPLSQLSLALPPKPKRPKDWDGATLYRPVAPAAGLIQAMGYTVSLAGVSGVDAAYRCNSDGKEWPCGVNARTAFRSFLRGRAVVCDIPQEAVPGAVEAGCRLGKQDIARWLVDNGWATAEAGGPYAEAEDKARKAGKGIFGRPPETADLPPPPPDVSFTQPIDPPKLSE